MITVLHTLRFLARCDRKILNKLCFKLISWRDNNNFDGVRIIVWPVAPHQNCGCDNPSILRIVYSTFLEWYRAKILIV